jgi:AbrB family looped-hinge helix DNA binding protein
MFGLWRPQAKEERGKRKGERVAGLRADDVVLLREEVVTKSTTITSKGQVTIPKDVRDRLGLGPSDRVEFEVLGDVAIMKRGPRRVRDVAAVVPALGISEAEVDERMKEDRAARWREKQS